MKKLILLLFLFSSHIYGLDCSKHPIYCQIVKNHPKINKAYAMKLSDIIHSMKLKYNIPANIFTAILMQESGYRVDAKRCNTVLIEKHTLIPNSYKYIEGELTIGSYAISYEKEKRCTDLGISQIYYKTANAYGFDLNRLIYDLEYSVEAGAIVLADFMKKYRHKDVDWFTRYNCGTRSTTRRKACQKYKRQIQRYL